MELIEIIGNLTGPTAGIAVLAVVYRLARFETELRINNEAIGRLADKVETLTQVNSDMASRVTYIEAKLLNGKQSGGRT